MRNVLLALIATSLAGCCGGYTGDNTRVYQRNDSEMLIFCENGGFVATLSETMLEGRFTELSADAGMATRGEDNQLAFEFSLDAETSTASTPQLGDTRWTEMELDEVARHHANMLCTDLETRSWWIGDQRAESRDPATRTLQ